jgi:hypothetical protein
MGTSPILTEQKKNGQFLIKSPTQSDSLSDVRQHRTQTYCYHVLSDSTRHRRTVTMYCPTAPDTDVLLPCTVRQHQTQTYRHVLSDNRTQTCCHRCPIAPDTDVTMCCPIAPDTDVLPPCVRQHRTQSQSPCAVCTKRVSDTRHARSDNKQC